jgi:1-acyl-sn-glycerol-3-phosphate acyltransferase
MGSSTLFDVPLLRRILQVAGRLYLKIGGWRREGQPPAVPKYVLIAAPHTSNWDFPLTLAIVFSFRLRICWMGKASLFRWPLRGFFQWLGGIPIDRAQAGNVVAESIRSFRERSHLIMVISPEGTREKVACWKTGFYRIATGAGVPIAIGFLDYVRKVGGFRDLFQPTGDMQVDLETIRGFYAGVMGRFPEKSVLTAIP